MKGLVQICYDRAFQIGLLDGYDVGIDLVSFYQFLQRV